MNFLKKIPTKIWILLLFFIVVTFLSFTRMLESFELPFYDMRFRWRLPLVMSDDVAIIEITDTTLKNLGKKWPIPRDYHASLVDILNESGAKAIVFDILFSETRLGEDDVFIQSIYDASNVYFPFSFYIDESKKGNQPWLESKEISTDILDSYKEYLKGTGHINAVIDPDGKIRRIYPFVKYEDKFYPMLPIKISCDVLGLDSSKVIYARNKIIIDGQLVLPINSRGEFMVNYPTSWAKSFYHTEYTQIIASYLAKVRGKEPKVDLSIFKDKVCFIGHTATTGALDLRANPFDKNYPMLGLQASVYNSLIKHKFITDAGSVGNTLVNLFILSLSLLICIRLRPLHSLSACIVIGLVYYLLAFCLFAFFGLWLDIFLPLNIIVVSWAGVTLYKFIDQARKRQILERELDIAKQIQQSFLPLNIGKFPGIDISAFMKPAKFVAGDLYDVVRLDDNRLGILIGDVSGKGVPASLIMAQTISLFRVFAKSNDDPAKVFELLNQELAAVLQGRFVTAIYIIIDNTKKKLYAVCAGHSPIVVYNADDDTVDDFLPESGLPLGIMEKAAYVTFEKDLKVGDKFLLYTDGISESRDKKGEEFGEQRIKDLLAENKSEPSGRIVNNIKDNVNDFSKGLPQFDDITLILIAAVMPELEE